METKNHNFVLLTRTPIVMVAVGPDGAPVWVDDPTREPEEVIGCHDCDMGAEEALELPNCAGMSLEKMMEEEGR